jgi:hypothetical protein
MISTEVVVKVLLDGEPENDLQFEIELSNHLACLTNSDLELNIWVHIWGAKDYDFRRWAYAYGQHGLRIHEQFKHIKFIEHTNNSDKLERARGNDRVDCSYENYFYAKTDLERPII